MEDTQDSKSPQASWTRFFAVQWNAVVEDAGTGVALAWSGEGLGGVYLLVTVLWVRTRYTCYKLGKTGGW